MNSSISIQNFWNEFIDLYRDLPALWKMRNPEYKNKSLKMRSYEILTNKLREIMPDATIASTKKKINSLRSNYRKDVRKIEDSIQLGASDDQIYTPRSWYFKKMSFLENEDAEVKPIKTEREETGDEEVSVSVPEDYEYFEDRVEEDEISNFKPNYNEFKNERVQHNGGDPDDPLVRTPSPSSTIGGNTNIHLKIERVVAMPQNQTSSLSVKKEPIVCSQPKRMRIEHDYEPDSDDDECEILAKAWILEYKKLNPEQQLYASKAISDILFEGRLQKLNYNSVKVNYRCECPCNAREGNSSENS